jgi:hypothetical protein
MLLSSVSLVLEIQLQQMDATLVKVNHCHLAAKFLGRNGDKYTNMLKVLDCYIDFHKIKHCIAFYPFLTRVVYLWCWIQFV